MKTVTYLANGDRVTRTPFGTFVHRRVGAYSVGRRARGKTAWRLIKSELKVDLEKPRKGPPAAV